MIEKVKLIFRKAVKLFKYERNNEKYWNDPKLYKQVVKKALPITKALYQSSFYS